MGSTGARIRGLDLIRGVAIALVMLRHAWPGIFDGAGIVGVVMFFALSGYLITGVLMRDVEQRHAIRYGRFYAHRALRLLPALLTLLLVFTVGELLIGPTAGTGRLIVGVVIGGLYLQDLVPFLSYPGINHLWTLAVEEQFYLIWPALLLLFVRQGWVKRGLTIMIGGAILLCALSVALATPLFGVQAIYALPTSWASALMIGGAAYLYRDHIASVLHRGRAWWVVAAAVVLAAFSMLPNAKLLPITYLVGAPLIAVCTVVIIDRLKHWQDLPSRALWPLWALGVISYGAYLWNGPMTHWPVDVAGWSAWSSIPLTIAAATISWWTVELVGRKWRERLDARAALARQGA